MLDIGKTTLVVKVDGQTLEIDVAAAYYDTIAMLEKVKGEREGRSDAEVNHAYYQELIAWAAEGGLSLTMSAAILLDRHIAEEFEKFKKKLPGLQTSVTESESLPASSPKTTGQSSSLTLEEFARKMNSGFVEQPEDSPPSESENSLKQPQETQTQPV